MKNTLLQELAIDRHLIILHMVSIKHNRHMQDGFISVIHSRESISTQPIGTHIYPNVQSSCHQ